MPAEMSTAMITTRSRPEEGFTAASRPRYVHPCGAWLCLHPSAMLRLGPGRQRTPEDVTGDGWPHAYGTGTATGTCRTSPGTACVG